ncbi:type II secretion system protein [Patescibacteria group bacterium]|nr:type II secretion system protein [Patescibacteria group bacterium]
MTRCKCGFTLIELLIVVSVVAILTAYLVRSMNINRHRLVAEDGVKIVNLEKLGQGVEAYISAEREMPGVNAGVPVGSSLNFYLQTWLDGYVYDPSVGSANEFVVYIQSSVDASSSITYFSRTGEIMYCTDPTSMGTCTSID